MVFKNPFIALNDIFDIINVYGFKEGVFRMQNQSRSPLYLQIQDYFKNEIVTKRLSPNEKIPTEREIMEMFNVSRITVANALTELAKEGWIFRVPGKGSFVSEDVHQLTNVTVQNQDLTHTSTELVMEGQKKRKMIGLIMPGINDFFAIRLINGINKVLEESEYYLVILLSQNSKEKEREAIRELMSMHAEGLLIFPVDAEIYNDDILELKVRHFPFVLIDRYLPGVETNYVNSDNVLGAKLAVSHLWDLGHRNIAICSDSALPTVSVELRIKGYMDALKEKGAMIDPSLILSDFRVDYDKFEPDHPLYQLMEKRSATAFITLNAKLGLYISSLSKRLGLKVPEDISILTYDDPSSGYDDFGVYTHISQSEYMMGQEAAKILLQLLTNQQNHTINPGYQKVNLTPKLIIKETTGVLTKLK